MKCQSIRFLTILGPVSLCTILLFSPASIGLAGESGLDTAKIESITGLKGVANEKENTFKVSKPRTDVAITVDQARLAPFMGFTSWATFTPGTKDNVMVMGDMVLFEDEVNPAMSAALDNGLEVTALHNHFFFDKPNVFFMHIGGEGTAQALGKGVKSALDAMKAVRGKAPQPRDRLEGRAIPATSSIDGAKVEAVFGVKGAAKDGMVKV